MAGRKRMVRMVFLYEAILLLEYLADRLVYGGILKAFGLSAMLLLAVSCAAWLWGERTEKRRHGETGRKGGGFWILAGISVLLGILFFAEPAVRRELFWYQGAVLLLFLAAARLLRLRFPSLWKQVDLGAAAALALVLPAFCLACGYSTIRQAQGQLAEQYEKVEWVGKTIPGWLEDGHWEAEGGFRGELLVSQKQLPVSEQELEIYLFQGEQEGKRLGLFYLPLRGELAAVWETDQDLSEICIE